MDKTIGIKTLSSNISEIYKLIHENSDDYDKEVKQLTELINTIQEKINILDEKINIIMNN